MTTKEIEMFADMNRDAIRQLSRLLVGLNGRAAAAIQCHIGNHCRAIEALQAEWREAAMVEARAEIDAETGGAS